MLRLFVIFWFLLLGFQQAFATELSTFENKLNEAEDYLVVNPAQSIIILENLDDIDKVSPELFIRWHLINARAAVPTSQFYRLHQSVDAIFSQQQAPYFKKKITSIMSALGIWLRYAEYLDDAQLSFQCGYKYAANDRQRLTLTNSMALVAMAQNNNDEARNLYAESYNFTVRLNLPNVVAMIESNLGYLALDENKIPEAEHYFRSALSRYQIIDKRAGQISAGLNLLMVFLIQDQTINFERLYGPTSTLTHAFPNEAKQALLLWLEMRFKKLKGNYVSRKDIAQLQIAYEQLESDQMKTFVHRYFAKKLEVPIVPPKKILPKKFTRSWFKLVKKCQW
ncbi:tetratricopeptide repeat protein [Pseudoalteromonas ostreae]|uniref:tetratricopeptide repeat protein n=1 Tax=Pseudoalteromonas ostreae TaxID=2774154 RepID=UPI001E5ACD8A|nr:tetratricopeptide repeat protein [Pseudoalteromonas ostreae]